MISKGGIQLQKVKLAMAVLGENKHYRWSTVLPRHWKSTAKKCGFPEDSMEKILQEFSEKSEDVIATVRQQLPSGFPKNLADSILDGILGKCASI